MSPVGAGQVTETQAQPITRPPNAAPTGEALLREARGANNVTGDGQNPQQAIIPITEQPAIKTDCTEDINETALNRTNAKVGAQQHCSHLRITNRDTGIPDMEYSEIDETQTGSLDNRDRSNRHSASLPVDNGQSGTDGDSARLADGGGGLGAGVNAGSDYSLEPGVTIHLEPSKEAEKRVSRSVNSHSVGDKWKKSRLKKGWLIKRIQGYDIVESEYGVSYLFVVVRESKKDSRKKVTTADFTIHEHAGFSTWETLKSNGRLKKGKLK